MCTSFASAEVVQQVHHLVYGRNEVVHRMHRVVQDMHHLVHQMHQGWCRRCTRVVHQVHLKDTH